MAELEKAASWHKQQSEAWERTATEQESALKELQDWTTELQTAAAWHKQQSEAWQRTAHEHEATAAELQRRLAELSSGPID